MTTPLRRLSLSILLIAACTPAWSAPDLSVALMERPVSACALTSAEIVKLYLFNHGNSLPTGTPIRISYTISGGAETSETLILAHPFAQNATMAYEFTARADLAQTGVHVFAASVGVAGDSNAANNNLSGHTVTHWARSVGGTLNGPGLDSSGTLTLSGEVGTVRQWQKSVDGGEDWEDIANTATTLYYEDLRRSTRFRAEVGNGTCTSAFSTEHTVAPN